MTNVPQTVDQTEHLSGPMLYEAARVMRTDKGEAAEAPRQFPTLEAAKAYVEESPVSQDGVRPWIRELDVPGSPGLFTHTRSWAMIAGQWQVEIISNGWPLQPLDRLFERLRNNQLDVSRNGIDDQGYGRFRFYGNFKNVSHAFNIVTRNPELIRRLTDAINENRKGHDYQRDCDVMERAHEQRIANLQQQGGDVQEAESVWTLLRPARAGDVRSGSSSSTPATASRKRKPGMR